MTIDWTGERFIPWMQGSLIHYEHLHRYAIASQLVRGKNVLDLACGEGYGSHLLSKDAKFVVGIDIDKNTVKHAQDKYKVQNLEFIQGSIVKLPIQNKNKFDVIICFEGIEHIEEHEQFLSEAKRILKKDGLFIISSPNKKTYSDDQKFENPFHRKELYFNEFRELLNKFFSNSVFLGQKVYCSSNIWPILNDNYSYKEFQIEKQEKEFQFAETKKKNPKYLIAIASDQKLLHKDYASYSNLIDLSDILIEDLNKEIANLNKEIAKLTQTLQSKNESVRILEETLKTIQNSLTWRMLMKYDRLIGKRFR